MTPTHSGSSDRVGPETNAVSATRAALEAISRLEGAYGPLMFFQSGGCCDGTAPLCLKADDMPVSANDLQLGEIGGAPFYIDPELYERWGRPHFVIDVSPGAAEGFSLEGLNGVHFVTLTASP
jgi:uncharacterized protein (DUF779 family)